MKKKFVKFLVFKVFRIAKPIWLAGIIWEISQRKNLTWVLDLNGRRMEVIWKDNGNLNKSREVIKININIGQGP